MILTKKLSFKIWTGKHPNTFIKVKSTNKHSGTKAIVHTLCLTDFFVAMGCSLDCHLGPPILLQMKKNSEW